MGQTYLPEAELLVIAAFSRHEEALHWARTRLETDFGPIAAVSPSYAFTQTAYYEATMGRELTKVFYVFQNLTSPDQLSTVKLRTNELEQELAASGRYAEPRPLNLDPGLLSLGKFVLATTKNQSHRIYLRDGIYAEVTLRFQDGQFHPWPWTYADYRQPEVLRFFEETREILRGERGKAKGERKSS